MPMSPRLLRPRAKGFHPEAQDWQNRVIANGGTVSGSTLSAVSKFCRDIDAAGIRDRFYRLNLFCGDNLSAALVPLYRAESATASVRGNTTDTNNNFVAADFNNTGSASGIIGNGTTKFLNTGLAANSFTASNIHMACGLLATDTGSGFRLLMGSFRTSSHDLSLSARRSDSQLSASFGLVPAAKAGESVLSAVLATGHIVAAYPSAYRNGSASGVAATTSTTSSAADNMLVFAITSSNSAFAHSNARLGSYSFGLTMTASQALAYSNAIAAFDTTLLRT